MVFILLLLFIAQIVNAISGGYTMRNVVADEGNKVVKLLDKTAAECGVACDANQACMSYSHNSVKKICVLKDKCLTKNHPDKENASNIAFKTYYKNCDKLKDVSFQMDLYSDNKCTVQVSAMLTVNKVHASWDECVKTPLNVYAKYDCDTSSTLKAKYFAQDSSCGSGNKNADAVLEDGACVNHKLGLFMKITILNNKIATCSNTKAPVMATPAPVMITGAPVKAAVCTAQDQEITKLKADMEKLRKQLSAFTTMAPVTMAPVTMAPVGSFYTTENRKRGCPNYATVTTSFKKNVPLVEECAKLCKAETWCVEFYHNGNIPKCMLAATGCGDGSNYAYTRYLMNGRDHKRGSATGAPSKASMAPTKMFSLQREKAGCPEYNALSKKGHVVWSTVTTKEACAASCMGQSWCVEFYFKREANVANNCMLTAKDCGDKKSYKWNRYVMHGRAHNRIMVTQAPVTQAPVDTQAITGAPVTMAPTPTMYTEEGSFACANFEKVTIVWKDGDLSYCATECQKWGPCKTFFHKTQKLQGGVKKDLPVGVCMLSTGDCENKNHWLWKKYNMNGKN